MSKDSKSINSVTKLTSTNYATWKGEMKAYLRVKGLWLLVNGSDPAKTYKWFLESERVVKIETESGSASERFWLSFTNKTICVS
jgi:hypothetical protein